jgi:biopolymer transport protein ExbD
MGMSAGGHETAVPYINVTPMIDVLLVILIIFMVQAPLKPSRFKALVPENRTKPAGGR